MILTGIWIKFKVSEDDLSGFETEAWISHADETEIRIIVADETKKDIIERLVSLGMEDESIRGIRKVKDLDYIVLWR